MCNKSNNYSFGQRLLLDIVPNLKWPIAILVIWTLLPADFGGSFSKFAKDNNLKKVGFGNTVLEMDPNQKIEQIKKANEKVNLTESVSETFKNLSKTSDEDLKKKLSKFEKAINSLQEQSSKILNETTKIFVQNYNLNLEFNKNKKNSFNFEIYAKSDFIVDISVGFDSLPFKFEFDLCDPSGYYKNLKSVKYDPSRRVIGLEYTSEKVNCKSSVSVTKMRNGSYMYEYDLNILNGFNVAKVDGFDVFLPVTTNRAVSNSLYIPGENNEVSSKYKNGEVVKRTLVFIE